MNRKPNNFGGFTLVELIIAIAITAVIGLAAAAVAVGISNSYSDSEDYYQSLQTARSFMMRWESEVRQARLITAWSSTGLVLWTGDADGTNNGVGNGQINRDELMLFQYNAAKKEIHQVFVQFPSTIDKTALNVIRSLATAADMTTISNMLTSDVYCQDRVVASNVTSFTLTVSPTAPKSTMAFLEVVVSGESKTLKIRSAAMPRANDIANVGTVAGQWVLSS